MKKSPGKLFGLRLPLAILTSCLFAASLHASVSWMGIGDAKGDGSWLTPTHWSSGLLPTESDDLVFAGSGGVVATGSSASLYGRDLKFDSGAYTLSLSGTGGRIWSFSTFSGADLSKTVITNQSAGQVINLSLIMAGDSAYTGTFSSGVGTLNIIKGGVGLLDVSGATLSHSSTTVSSGTLRISGASSGVGVPTGAIQVGSATTAGYLEIDGKGNASTLSKALNQTDGTIRFGSAVDGGLAGLGAVNGQLTVNLTSGAWGGGAYFKVNVLQLGTANSTDRVVWASNLSITKDRTIRAGGNGALAVDGEFSGSLAMANDSGRGVDAVLSKDGSGTILFSGNSDAFLGRLRVAEGRLNVGGRFASATSNSEYGIRVEAGATLEGGGTITLSNAAAKLVVAGTLKAGDGGADKVLRLSSALKMEESSLLSFAVKGNDQSDYIALIGGASWSFQANQLVSIVDMGIAPDGGIYTLITGLIGFESYDFSNWRVSSSLEGELSYQDGALYYQTIPEPSHLTLLGLGLGAGLLLVRKKHCRS